MTEEQIPMFRLRNEILRQAIDDYMSAWRTLRSIQRIPDNPRAWTDAHLREFSRYFDALKIKKDVERFLKSPYFEIITPDMENEGRDFLIRVKRSAERRFGRLDMTAVDNRHYLYTRWTKAKERHHD